MHQLNLHCWALREIRIARDQSRLEQFLNSLEAEIVAIIPNVTPVPATHVGFLLIVEKVR